MTPPSFSRPEEDIRLECLRLALSEDGKKAMSGRHVTDGRYDYLLFARELFAFVSGEADLTPRQKIEAALAEMEGARAK